jgi:hypothetical protein
VSRTADPEAVRHNALAQIEHCDTILARHQSAGPTCSCGRGYPCPVRESVETAKQRFMTALTLLDKTQEVPLIPTSSSTRLAKAKPRHRRRGWPMSIIRRLLE